MAQCEGPNGEGPNKMDDMIITKPCSRKREGRIPYDEYYYTGVPNYGKTECVPVIISQPCRNIKTVCKSTSVTSSIDPLVEIKCIGTAIRRRPLTDRATAASKRIHASTSTGCQCGEDSYINTYLRCADGKDMCSKFTIIRPTPKKTCWNRDDYVVMSEEEEKRNAQSSNSSQDDKVLATLLEPSENTLRDEVKGNSDAMIPRHQSSDVLNKTNGSKQEVINIAMTSDNPFLHTANATNSNSQTQQYANQTKPMPKNPNNISTTECNSRSNNTDNFCSRSPHDAIATEHDNFINQQQFPLEENPRKKMEVIKTLKKCKKIVENLNANLTNQHDENFMKSKNKFIYLQADDNIQVTRLPEINTFTKDRDGRNSISAITNGEKDNLEVPETPTSRVLETIIENLETTPTYQRKHPDVPKITLSVQTESFLADQSESTSDLYKVDEMSTSTSELKQTKKISDDSYDTFSERSDDLKSYSYDDYCSRKPGEEIKMKECLAKRSKFLPSECSCNVPRKPSTKENIPDCPAKRSKNLSDCSCILPRQPSVKENVPSFVLPESSSRRKSSSVSNCPSRSSCKNYGRKEKITSSRSWLKEDAQKPASDKSKEAILKPSLNTNDVAKSLSVCECKSPPCIVINSVVSCNDSAESLRCICPPNLSDLLMRPEILTVLIFAVCFVFLHISRFLGLYS